jgi:hypothetical protein
MEKFFRKLRSAACVKRGFRKGFWRMSRDLLSGRGQRQKY